MYFQYDNSGTPLGFVYNETQYFYVTNQMGDVIGITDANGTLLAQYAYDDWGKLVSIDTADAEGETACLELANANPLRYRGYYFDSETGYYYLQSRYYAPEICRFINADIPEIAKVSKSISNGVNIFAYCNNDSINNSDASGYISFRMVSFDQMKSVISNAFNFLKNSLKKIIKRVGIWKKGNTLYIKTSLLSNLIDTVIMVGSAIKAVAIKSAFKVIKAFVKSNEKRFTKFVKNNLIPFIANNLKSVISYCLNSFALSFALKGRVNAFKDDLRKSLLKNFALYKWINMISSTGNFISNIFDMVDGKWNGKIEIKLK